MRPEERVGLLLDDLDGLLEEGAELVARGRNAYDQDRALRRACEAICIHIGEIVKQLTALEPDRYRDPLWSAAARNRDLLAHHYERVDAGQLWNTMAVHLPELTQLVARARER